MISRISAVAVAILLCLCEKAVAQDKPNPILTADSLATGNYKDVLNSFFQLAFERLGSADKEVKFTGTPFAVMAKLDTALLKDKIYRKYRVLRNLNYMFSIRLDTAYKFDGFSSGIKYALINRRDETVSKAFLGMVVNGPMAKMLFALNDSISIRISGISPSSESTNLMLEYTDFRRGKKNFGELSKNLQEIILTVLKANDATHELATELGNNNDFNMAKTAADYYQELKDNFNKNLLWTIGVTDTTYNNQFTFSNIVFQSELLKGINQFAKAKNDLELNIQSALQLVDDSLKAGRDLKRVLFRFEPGINLAFKTKVLKKSYLEIKFSGGYYHNFSYLYANEDRDHLVMNTTIRIRILNDIWVPFEIKYDPKNGNLFGFINVRANFKALAGAAKQL